MDMHSFRLYSDMKRIFSTLRALVEVMEVLAKDADPSGVGRLIQDEVQYSCYIYVDLKYFL